MIRCLAQSNPMRVIDLKRDNDLNSLNFTPICGAKEDEKLTDFCLHSDPSRAKTKHTLATYW